MSVIETILWVIIVLFSLCLVIYIVIGILVNKNVIKNDYYIWKVFKNTNQPATSDTKSINDSNKNTTDTNNPTNPISGTNSTGNTAGSTTGNANTTENTTGTSSGNVMDQSTVQCLLKQSSFKSMTNNLPDYTQLDDPTDQEIITSFCQLGNDIKTCKSNIIVDPTLDANYNNFCCDNNKSICDSVVATQCVFEKANLTNQSKIISTLGPNTLFESDNAAKLSNFCQLGADIMANNCSIDQYHPLNNSVYTTYCCNNIIDAKACNNDAMNCPINKSTFSHNSNALALVSDATLANPANIDQLTSFCALGNSIIKDNCEIDENHPINNKTFQKLCCKGTTDSTVCADASSLNCSINSGKFIVQANVFANFNDAAISSNLDLLSNFCSTGQSLIDNNCSSVVWPMNNPAFQKYCCNGSSDVNACKSNSVCLNTTASFLNNDSSLKGFVTTQIGPNIGKLTQYCQNGSDMLSSNCLSIVNPQTKTTFQNFCKHPDCLSNVAQFMTTDKSLSNGNFAYGVSGSDQTNINNYCSASNQLLANGCTDLVNPQNSATFRSVCCKNSNNTNDCSPAATQCFIDINNFGYQSSILSSVADNQSQWGPNKPLIDPYCATAKRLVSNACGYDPLSQATYQKFQNYCNSN